jgi:hypothetical protein
MVFMATIFAESGPNAVCFWRSWRLDNAKAAQICVQSACFLFKPSGLVLCRPAKRPTLNVTQGAVFSAQYAGTMALLIPHEQGIEQVTDC